MSAAAVPTPLPCFTPAARRCRAARTRHHQEPVTRTTDVDVPPHSHAGAPHHPLLHVAADQNPLCLNPIAPPLKGCRPRRRSHFSTPFFKQQACTMPLLHPLCLVFEAGRPERYHRHWILSRCRCLLPHLGLTDVVFGHQSSTTTSETAAASSSTLLSPSTLFLSEPPPPPPC
jgi:hypothetical protein